MKELPESFAKKWGIDVASILGNVYICASMFYGSHITDRGPCCSGRGSFLLCNNSGALLMEERCTIIMLIV